MKFLCLKEKLIDSINIVSKAVSPRSVLTVIEGIYIKATDDGNLKLVGNDLEIGIESIISADVRESGEIVLNAKMFGDIVRKLPSDNVEIEVLDNYITRIVSGNTKFEISGINAAEFPDLPTFNPEFSIEMKRKSLKDMINNTRFSVGTNQNKVILTGCLLETTETGARMVAVDGYRMAIRNVELDKHYDAKSVVIPSKALSELDKIIKDDDEKIEINYTSNHAVFVFDNCRLVTRLIEGEYINYNQIIPVENKIEIKCNVSDFINAVERAAVVITNEINKSHIRINIANDNINVFCETNIGRAEDNISVKTGKEEIEIGFNHKFLLDALKACDEDEVLLKLNESVTPCTITPIDSNDFLYLILPIRLKAE